MPTAPIAAPLDRYLRLPEVTHITGRCRTMIYCGMNDGTFPKSRALGPRSIGWLESEIQAWIQSRAAESRAA